VRRRRRSADVDGGHRRPSLGRARDGAGRESRYYGFFSPKGCEGARK
jgi:hypothetical protein